MRGALLVVAVAVQRVSYYHKTEPHFVAGFHILSYVPVARVTCFVVGPDLARAHHVFVPVLGADYEIAVSVQLGTLVDGSALTGVSCAGIAHVVSDTALLFGKWGTHVVVSGACN